ncbi:hypothetical protein Q9966_010200 [Columba livia]|nr:hypothetical protein Q9966_010200 [Columba livia]
MFHLQTRNKHGKNSHCSGIWPQVAEEGIETQKIKKKSFLKQTELPISPLYRRNGHMEHSADGWAVACVQLCRKSTQVFQPVCDRQRAGSSVRVGTILSKGERNQQDGI